MESPRVDAVKPSATLRIADLAAKLRGDGKDVISMSLGEPDFPTPPNINQAAKEALERGETHYTSTRGIPPLLEAITAKLRSENSLDVSPDNILVTAGAKHAIFMTCMALLHPGDEVLLLDPAWVSYDAMVRMAEAKGVWVPSNDEFKPMDVQDYVSPKTRMIIVNSPNNPSGAVFNKKELKAIADVAIDHDLLVLSDEIYEKIIYDVEHHSIGSFDGMHDRTITINGFSKAYAMTGWRLGYLAAQEGMVQAILKVQQHSVSCATSFAQWGGLEALVGPQESVVEMREVFRERRDLLVSGLRDLGVECPMPEGAFYAFPRVGDGSSVAEEWLSRAHVAVTPGGAFGPGSEDHVRISYATSTERIREALSRVEDLII